MLQPGLISPKPTSRSGSLKGNGASKTAFTTVNMAVLAPIAQGEYQKHEHSEAGMLSQSTTSATKVV